MRPAIPTDTSYKRLCYRAFRRRSTARRRESVLAARPERRGESAPTQRKEASSVRSRCRIRSSGVGHRIDCHARILGSQFMAGGSRKDRSFRSARVGPSDRLETASSSWPGATDAGFAFQSGGAFDQKPASPWAIALSLRGCGNGKVEVDRAVANETATHPPACSSLTVLRRGPKERMMSFSASTTRKNTKPPSTSQGQTHNGMASTSNRNCNGGA